MTHPASGDDPVVRALDQLVETGQLTPDRARAAYEASRGDAPPAQPVGPPPGAEEAEPLGGMRLDVVATAVGVALVATTIALSGVYSRAEADLDWSNFGLGVIATLGLFGVAAGALVLVKDDERKANLIAWPGAVGAVGAGLMIGVAMEDNAVTGYLAGLVTAAIGAGGCFLVRRGAFVVAAIAGLFVAYASLFDDLFNVEGGDGDNAGMKIATALLIYAVAVTAGGWFLPTRDIGGVFVGAVTVVGFVGVLVVLVVAAALAQAFGGLDPDLQGGGSSGDRDVFDNDVYVILLFTLVLVAGWAVCSWLSGHVGYRVLILVSLTTVVPLATFALIVEHPSYWGLGFGIVGAAVLGVVGLRGIGILSNLGRRKPPPPPGGGGPVGLDRPA